MSVSSSKSGNTITISIVGRFDFSSRKEFRDIYTQTDEAECDYIVDMSKTEYIDSSALGMLLLLREHVGSEQSKITINNASGDVKGILLVSNFDKLFILS